MCGRSSPSFLSTVAALTTACSSVKSAKSISQSSRNSTVTTRPNSRSRQIMRRSSATQTTRWLSMQKSWSASEQTKSKCGRSWRKITLRTLRTTRRKCNCGWNSKASWIICTRPTATWKASTSGCWRTSPMPTSRSLWPLSDWMNARMRSLSSRRIRRSRTRRSRPTAKKLTP